MAAQAMAGLTAREMALVTAHGVLPAAGCCAHFRCSHCSHCYRWCCCCRSWRQKPTNRPTHAPRRPQRRRERALRPHAHCHSSANGMNAAASRVQKKFKPPGPACNIVDTSCFCISSMEGRAFAPALTPSQVASLLLLQLQHQYPPQPTAGLHSAPTAPSAVGRLGEATSKLASACGFALSPPHAPPASSAAAVAISPHALPSCLPALSSVEKLELDDSGVDQAMELASLLCSGVARCARVAIMVEGPLPADVIRHLVVGHEFVHLDAAAPLQAARGAVATLAPAFAETVLCAAAAERALCAATAEMDFDAAISNLLVARLFRAKDTCVVITGLSAVATSELARVATTIGMRAICLPRAPAFYPSAYEFAMKVIEPFLEGASKPPLEGGGYTGGASSTTADGAGAGGAGGAGRGKKTTSAATRGGKGAGNRRSPRGQPYRA